MGYSASNENKIVNDGLRKWKEEIVTYFKSLFQYLHAWTE